MKLLSFIVRFVLVWFFAAPLHADESRVLSLKEQRVEVGRAVSSFYSYEDNRPDMLAEFYYPLREKGISDTVIRDTLVDGITTWVESSKKPAHVVKQHAGIAMDLFRGDPIVERAVLEAHMHPDRYMRYPNSLPVDMSLMVSLMGSDELVAEFRKLIDSKEKLEIFDSKVRSRPQFKRDAANAISFPGAASSAPPTRFTPDAWRPERPRGAQANRKNGSLVISVFESPFTWWSLGVSVLGLMVFIFGYYRKKRVWLFSGVVLVVGGVVLYFLWPHSTTAPSSPGGLPKAPSGGNTEPHGSNPARFKPDAWRPARPNFPVPGPRERTPYDILSDEVRQLMAPFYAADPQDRAGNQKAKEEAAIKLLAVLEKGMPKGCREDNWLGVVGQIVGCQSCSPACMDLSIEMIGTWIGNPQRTEMETTTAFREMMNWRQKDAVNPGTPELKRFERIAEMAETMFSKASTRAQGELLFVMEGAAKLVNRPKSQMPEKIVDDQRLLGLMATMRKSAADAPDANSRVMMAMRNRVVSAPESFATFEAMAKDILTGAKTDVMGTMQGLEMIAKAASSGSTLPSWMDDAGIAREITALHQKGAKFGKDSLAVQRTGFVSSGAMEVIRARMQVDPASVAKHYGEVLMFIAGDADADQNPRLDAVRLAVKSGIVSAREAGVKFGSDPLIGESVVKEFPSE
jgi:hypothetical protein